MTDNALADLLVDKSAWSPPGGVDVTGAEAVAMVNNIMTDPNTTVVLDGGATQPGDHWYRPPAREEIIEREPGAPQPAPEPTATERRLRLHRTGFSPIPIQGKIPPLPGWQTKIDTNAGEIKLWGEMFAYAQSTGILTARTPAFDIDIKNEAAAKAVDDYVREYLGGRDGVLMVRFGARPKRALLFQTSEPFKKIQISLVGLDNSTDQKLEFLGTGQQIVAFGTHPGTGKPYDWFGGQPGDVERDALPHISADEAREIVEGAAKLLVAEHGYKRTGPSSKPAADGATTISAQARDWDEDLGNIAAGRELHDSVASLAMKLLLSGMSDGATINFLRAQLNTSTAQRNERFQERLAEIPRAVSSARGKIGDGEQTEGGVPAKDKTPPPNISAAAYVMPDPSKIPRREFLYGKHYLRGEVSGTIAAGGRAKTTLDLTEAIGMTVGRNLLTGVAIPCGPLRVWFVNAEEDQDELDRRIAAICQHYEISALEIGNRLIVTSLKGKPQWHIATVINGVATINQAVIDRIVSEIEANAIDVLMLDPLVSFHAVSESDNKHMDVVIKEGLYQISTKTRAAVAFAHHTGKPKPGQADAIVEDSRGASAIIWAARLNRVLNLMSPAEANKLGIGDDDRRLYVRISGGAKSNPAPPEKAAWMKLYPIDLPNGDQVAVVVPWKLPDPFAAAAPDVAYKVRALVQTGEFRTYSASPEWFGFVVAPLLGLSLAYGANNKKEDIVRIKNALKIWKGTKVLDTQKRKDKNYQDREYFILGSWKAPGENENTPGTDDEPDFDAEIEL